ncbi:hypothetical protein NP233_g5789 [Leucocoprinus birnbaumii]|uniref:Extracellular serine-rich protein n=1 Tax=Leucocoprinus birnbaumii TaxID=56174 RepID=A0AAD5VUW4_9AGAR|nr:hypothetical protein NP233_g5789 [Leucocoprinus birnbaumii]
MRFATAIASLSFLGLAFAQNSSNVVTIQVGSTEDAPGGIFQFIPNNVTATNGTVINFRFSGMPGNHSVTQSTFNDPCTPMVGGFDSGWVFLPNPGLTPIPEWNLTITNDSHPIWFFCKQLAPTPHCLADMVGAINPPTSGDNSFDNYRSRASQAGNVGQDVHGLVGIGASASMRPSPVPSGATDYPLSLPSTFPSANPSSTGSGGAASPTGSSAAMGLTAQSGFVAFVAGLTGILLA